tara:strand:- start:387 stop:638 length:252 start_codon:yes stop_codon:yes gene_type:complete
MQIQSKGGSMVCDYYPIKDLNGNLKYDKVLRILTFMGETMSKKVISIESYLNEVYDKIHTFKYVDNNVDHSNVPQFVSLKEVN